MRLGVGVRGSDRGRGRGRRRRRGSYRRRGRRRRMGRRRGKHRHRRMGYALTRGSNISAGTGVGIGVAEVGVIEAGVGTRAELAIGTRFLSIDSLRPPQLPISAPPPSVWRLRGMLIISLDCRPCWNILGPRCIVQGSTDVMGGLAWAVAMGVTRFRTNGKGALDMGRVMGR